LTRWRRHHAQVSCARVALSRARRHDQKDQSYVLATCKPSNRPLLLRLAIYKERSASARRTFGTTYWTSPTHKTLFHRGSKGREVFLRQRATLTSARSSTRAPARSWRSAPRTDAVGQRRESYRPRRQNATCRAWIWSPREKVDGWRILVSSLGLEESSVTLLVRVRDGDEVLANAARTDGPARDRSLPRTLVARSARAARRWRRASPSCCIESMIHVVEGGDRHELVTPAERVAWCARDHSS